jgi:hypothetical protein
VHPVCIDMGNMYWIDIQKYLDLEVKKIEEDGGWYCFYDFDIITK